MRSSIILRRLALCGAALALLCCLLSCGRSDFGGLEIHILDVGQGDAALICQGTHCMMIDAGPNAAEEDLCATLDAMGIRELETVIFTHPDEDHIGGGDLLLARFAVGTVYFSPISTDDTSFARLVKAAASSGADVRIGAAGESFPLGDAVISLLAPSAAHEETNTASIITRIDYGKTAALFMADADETTEAILLAAPDDLRADLLKIAHHGANSSTSDSLLDAVRPTHAAISCGYANGYGHPTRRVINALKARQIEIARTDRDGTVCYRSDGDRLWRDTDK